MYKIYLPWDDIVDTRDILARRDELATMIECNEATDLDEKEFRLLEALVVDLADVRDDWVDEGPLIRDSYFKHYARELHEETCDPDTAPIVDKWPYRHIDWDEAAEELQQDYTSIDVEGVDYWIRSC